MNKWDLDKADNTSEKLVDDETINKAKVDLKMDDMIKVSAKTGYNMNNNELVQKIGRLSKRPRKPRVNNFCRTL